MSGSLYLDKAVPAAYAAATDLAREAGVAAEAAGLDRLLVELVNMRVSQLNGCAFCIDMHTTDAVKAGEDPRRLFAVAAWRESPFFTDAERAALELTDAVTRLGEHGVPDEVWDPVVAAYGETTAAELVVAIATINVWNRLAITNHSQPPALAR
jgi:AhpD family alkylhydroperoxidase